jgi:alpha-L-fucosidase
MKQLNSIRKSVLITAFSLLLTGGLFAQVIADGTIDTGNKYADAKLKSDESPEVMAKRMEWFKEAKFGMFIHWGVYSKAGGEWNGETNHAEWLQLTAKIPLAEYKTFARTFNPVKFNADEWVSIAKNAGMKYLVITSKHHDGFAMFDSPSNAYNIIKGTAFNRDPIKELAEACRKQDIRFCVYYSLGRDWEDPDVPTGSGDKVGWRSNLIDFPDESKKDFQKYFDRKVKPQVRELLTNYGPIGIMWFDTYELISHEQSMELFQMIRELQPNCIINSRIGRGLGDYGISEGKIPADGSMKPWETCMTMNNHWSYNKADEKWKSSEELTRNLIDIASKGGNFLLNGGPTGEGIIPEPSVIRLEEMGRWLKVNGEAIYGTKFSPFGKLAWGRCTQKVENGNTMLYFSVFNWPSNGKLVLPKFSNKILKSTLLANGKAVKTVSTGEGVVVELPTTAPSAIASVVKIEITGLVNSEIHKN